jgi:hypothetical protein
MLNLVGGMFLLALLLVPCYMLVATTVWPRSKDAPQWAVDILAGMLLLGFVFGLFTFVVALWEVLL